ncbi:hypothetical protein R6L23_19170 [Streptomyces sp. SR27]|uniref:hypothetical protein n=1 Tax=Streptomyces sp. SR27 TaxID=3076630 RepID=UPI00295BB22A|nr:hypothetical protein [Streptomyces sp. SR27]MDV9190307.1 hypothetical protein [Streptomyces sp. SR27]
MAIFVHAILPGITTDQYDTLNSRLQETPEIFDGCVSHTCVATGDGLEIFDVWESEGQMEAFAERMMPVSAALGWPSDMDRPEVLKVHNYWVPGAGG